MPLLLSRARRPSLSSSAFADLSSPRTMRSTGSIRSCSSAGKEVPGKSACSVTRGDFVYLFSTADTKATFERDPARYEIQLGGLCAKMGKTAGGNPSDFIVHEGKIYIFGSDDCHKKFQAAAGQVPGHAGPPHSRPRRPPRHAAVELIDRAVTAIGGAPAARRAHELCRVLLPQSRLDPRARPRSPPGRCGAFPTACGRNAPWRSQGKTMTSATMLAPQRACGFWAVRVRRSRCARPAGPASNRTSDATRSRSCGHGGPRVQGCRARHRPPSTACRWNRSASSMARLTSPSGSKQPDAFTALRFATGTPKASSAPFTVRYSDYRAVEGLQLPFTTRVTFNGQPDPSQSATIESISLNSPLDASLFAPKTPEGR